VLAPPGVCHDLETSQELHLFSRVPTAVFKALCRVDILGDSLRRWCYLQIATLGHTGSECLLRSGILNAVYLITLDCRSPYTESSPAVLQRNCASLPTESLMIACRARSDHTVEAYMTARLPTVSARYACSAARGWERKSLSRRAVVKPAGPLLLCHDVGSTGRVLGALQASDRRQLVVVRTETSMRSSGPAC
jgi:hypothetical protein